MTPQEKAQELIKKYDCGGLETFAGHSVKKIAKQCALIAVDEILSKRLVAHLPWQEVEYWEQVKTEIEKL